MCCHDDRRDCGFRKPDWLKEKPAECTPEQIRECHGEGGEHPCAPEGKRA